MVLRRKKLLRNLCKKELISGKYKGKDGSQTINSMIKERESQKNSLLNNFTIGYLEEMLKSTTKSIARDVVNTLIPAKSSGILTLIEHKENKNNIKEEEKEMDSDFKEAKEVSSEIQKVIIHSKPQQNLSKEGPYAFTMENKIVRSKSSKPTTPTLNNFS